MLLFLSCVVIIQVSRRCVNLNITGYLFYKHIPVIKKRIIKHVKSKMNLMDKHRSTKHQQVYLCCWLKDCSHDSRSDCQQQCNLLLNQYQLCCWCTGPYSLNILMKWKVPQDVWSSLWWTTRLIKLALAIDYWYTLFCSGIHQVHFSLKTLRM